ncbi:hypothetical protein [Clostridium sardiniense]|uniref:hypothetical protein n=1 Tax=Clostridium sardiniense TaxID=29369 RepID=UPI0019579EA7|nr:hypothetical protein [Clostridium sardiniense]MBM7834959.1 hypothetical protein [Clostridium sardiniense]
MKKIVALIILFMIIGMTVSVYGFEKKDIKLKSDNDILVSKLKFNINDKGNMQGLTYNNNIFYVGFDRNNDNGEIIAYDNNGNEIKRSGLLKIGHAAGLAYRTKNNSIYVANGGGKNKTHIYEVKMSGDKTYISKDLDYSKLGNSGLVAIDNDDDKLIIHTSINDNENHIISICDFNGKVEKQISIKNQGVPQGLEYYDGYIILYTNNKVTFIDSKSDEIKKTYKIKEKGESEGITIFKEGNKIGLTYGYNDNNRLYITDIE